MSQARTTIDTCRSNSERPEVGDRTHERQPAERGLAAGPVDRTGRDIRAGNAEPLREKAQRLCPDAKRNVQHRVPTLTPVLADERR